MRISLALAALCLAACQARAASLQVEPVLVEVLAPGVSSSLILRNDGTSPVTAQIRVYRWSQSNGQEKLEPAEDVAASPPAATIAPGSLHTVRIVRTRKTPVVGEESYRLLIDQLPQPAQARTGMIKLVMRHSIPVFFRAGELSNPTISWSAEVAKGKLIVTARNEGQRRLRIAGLQVRDEKGSAVKFGDGLVGYALGRSTMRWTTSLAGKGLTGGQLSVSAYSDMGRVDAVAAKVTP